MKLKKINLPPFFSIYLPVIITVFAILMLSIFFLKPKVQDIILINSTLKSSREKLEKLNQKINFLQKIDSHSLNEKNSLLTEALPVSKNIPYFLGSIESIASENKVRLTLIRVNPGEISTPSAASNKDPLVKTFKDSYQLEVTTQGTIKNLIKFLERLNSSSPIVTIEQASLSFDEKKDSESNLANLQVNLFAYFYPEIKSIGKISDPLPQITETENQIYEKLTKFSTYTISVDFVPTGKKNPFTLIE